MHTHIYTRAHTHMHTLTQIVTQAMKGEEDGLDAELMTLFSFTVV